MGFPVHNVWIAVDLDGTLMEGGHFPDFGPPTKGAQSAMQTLRDMGFKIMVWSSRTSSTDTDGKFQNINRIVKDIEAWLDKHHIPYDYIVSKDKKPSLIYRMIDDRAIPFKGNWDAVLDEIIKDLVGRGIYPIHKAALDGRIRELVL